MQTLVTLRQAKAHLNLPLEVTVGDGDLTALLAAAHASVEKFIKNRRTDADLWAAEVDAWTDATAPAYVKQQIKLAFGYLYRHRGDDEPGSALPLGELPREFTALIWGDRDPTVA